MRAGEVGYVVIPFAVVALLTIPMAIGIDTPLLSRVGPGIFWAVVLLFGVIVTQRHSAATPPEVRDMLLLGGVDPATRFIATSVASFILLLAFEVAAGIATVFLYNPQLTDWTWLALILPLAAAGFAMVGTIAGGITGGLDMRASLAPLIAVPISVPLLLGAAQATEGLRLGAGILRWLLLLAVVDVVLAIAGVLIARPLEEAGS
jgi:heme exporter protein B